VSVYLDYNATARVRPEAAAAVARALQLGGNPSSVHAAGRAARAVVEAARADVARLVGALPASVVFTSGGTEANALAIESAVRGGCGRIIVGATEHDAVLENARAAGVPVEIWPVDDGGVADLIWLVNRLNVGPRALVCLMLANNETGVIQPVAAAAEAVRAADGWLHVDAVQAAGKIPIDLGALGADTPARWWPGRGRRWRGGCTAAARSAAGAPAPRTSPASPASARRPVWPRTSRRG